MRVPVESLPGAGDFDRVWMKVRREIQREASPRGWESLLSWFNLSSLFRKKVWIPAAAALSLLLVLVFSPRLKETPSIPVQYGVEYVESKTNNVMVYEVGPAVTVIWLFEGDEEEATPS